MKVYLIGAGPGDAGLLTLKGRDALACADVVVYDALANDSLLGHARPDAERIYVGKVAGNHALPQHEINALLVRKAKEGKVVARLKGGDPYIFGRGGEEAEELLAAGVPFEEVPGISSTIAAPAYAGIPLTHRNFASSVTIITGHENPDKPGSVHNWKALAASASTLVFVMGMKNLPDIARHLLDAGMDPDTPAALVYRGTTPYQRSLVATISTLPQAAVDNKFSNPSVIVVGKVCSLHDQLGWFEQRPLYGRSIVVTRAREQASGLAQSLTELGANVIQCPTIEISPLADYSELDAAVARLAEYGRDYRYEDFRKQVTLLSQKTFVYSASVRDNLTMFSGTAQQDEALTKTLERAGLSKWYAERGASMDTQIGGEEHALSGGEERRLDLARTLWRKGSLVMLDEPAAGLDEKTRVELEKQIAQLPCDILIVAMHNYSPEFLGSFTRVFRMKDGELTK